MASDRRLLEADRGSRVRARHKLFWIVWSGLIASLAIVVGATGLSRVYQSIDPSRALALWPYNIDAAITLAEKQLELKTADGRREASLLARQVLQSAPLNYKAMRILGLLAAQERQFDTADAFMAAAIRRSNRDSASQLWIFRRAVARGDYYAAFRAADAVLRRRPKERQTLFPAMFAMLDYAPEARPALAERLVWLPNWRLPFLQTYARSAPSPDLVEALFIAIDQTIAPVTDPEFTFFLMRLVQAKEYQRAYAAWSARLQSDRLTGGAIFDGGFDLSDALPPFGWTIRRGAGLLVERTQAPLRETRALHVEFSGSGKAQSIAEQLLILPAGDYTFSALSLFFSSQEPERIGWSLDCEGGSTVMDARDLAPVLGKWMPLQAPFTVPTADCPALRLRLRVVSGDTLAPLSVWYDDLRIAPAPISQDIP